MEISGARRSEYHPKIAPSFRPEVDIASAWLTNSELRNRGVVFMKISA
jgi:hypothetical protein